MLARKARLTQAQRDHSLVASLDSAQGQGIAISACVDGRHRSEHTRRTSLTTVSHVRYRHGRNGFVGWCIHQASASIDYPLTFRALYGLVLNNFDTIISVFTSCINACLTCSFFHDPYKAGGITSGLQVFGAATRLCSR